jgi:adenylate cyclase
MWERVMPGQCQTFLFADIVGFTAVTHRLGDEGAAELALDFRRRVRAMLDEHHAHEVKGLGDAVMLRAEDPVLAMRLGVRIVREFASGDGDPTVRVGMHTGQGVERDGDWYGAAVNLASRLCQAAGPGEVLVSESTSGGGRRPRHVHLGEPRAYVLKNVDIPLTARRAQRCVDAMQELLARMRVPSLALVFGRAAR